MPRLLFRFGIGLTEITARKLAAALDQGRSVPSPEASPEPRPFAPRDALIGAAVAAPGALTALRARLAAPAARARRLTARGVRALRHPPGAGLAAARARQWRARMNRELVRLMVMGWCEAQAGRSLAAGAIRQVAGTGVARVAESDDIKRVIREQSEGITVAMITRLRARSAWADGALEAAVRRFIGPAREHEDGKDGKDGKDGST